MNPFQVLLNNYQQDREKREYEQFIEEERRRHGHLQRDLNGQSWGTVERRPFLVAPRRAGAGGSFRAATSSATPGGCGVGEAQADRRRLPAFSFDAIHRPFCATPSPRQAPLDCTTDERWTPRQQPQLPSWISPACATPLQTWSLPVCTPPVDVETSTPAPMRPPRLIMPSLSPAPAPLALPDLVDAEPALAAPVAVTVGSSIESTLAEKEEESADALLSLVTLSCASPTASPRQQSRRLPLVGASEKLAELTMRKRKRDASEEPSGQGGNAGGDNDDDEDLEQQFCYRRRRSSAERNKRRRVELNVDACHRRPMDQAIASDQASAMMHAEQHETQQQPQQQQGTEAESDVEESIEEEEEELENDQRQLVLLLGEESANEDEADESHRRPDQKMVMEMEEDEGETEQEGSDSRSSVCRGRRRIWASISSRELASLQWHQPLPGRRQTRVSRMGLGRLHVRPVPVHTTRNTQHASA